MISYVRRLVSPTPSAQAMLKIERTLTGSPTTVPPSVSPVDGSSYLSGQQTSRICGEHTSAEREYGHAEAAVSQGAERHVLGIKRWSSCAGHDVAWFGKRVYRRCFEQLGLDERWEVRRDISPADTHGL